MNRTRLPAPPNPVSYPSVGLWQTAVFNWMSQVKGQIEEDTAVNISPISVFAVGTYTPTSTITGTDATSNFVATLVAGLLQKGILSSHTPRG